MLRGNTRESWTRTRGVGWILGHTWHAPTPVPSSRWAWETKFLARLIRVPARAEERAAGNGCSAPHSMTRTSTWAPTPISTGTPPGGCLAATPAAPDRCRGHPTAHRTPSRPGGVGRRLRSPRIPDGGAQNYIVVSSYDLRGGGGWIDRERYEPMCPDAQSPALSRCDAPPSQGPAPTPAHAEAAQKRCAVTAWER